MNPKPFSSLNHFTVPVGICPSVASLDGGQTSSPGLRNVSSAALEVRLARTVLEKRLHGSLEVVAPEQRGRDIGHPLVGPPHSMLEKSPNNALGGRVGHGGPPGQPLGEAEGLLLEIVVG